MAARFGLRRLEERHDSRTVIGTYVLINSAISIALLAGIAALTKQPFVFPSLGPTAFLLFYAATSAQAAPRNVFCGHLIGVLTGGGEVNPLPILMKNVRVQGIYVGSREMFEAMNRAIALHKLRPVVDRVVAFQEIKDALRYLESGAHFGKIALRIT